MTDQELPEKGARSRWRRYTFTDLVCIAIVAALCRKRSARQAIEIVNENRQHFVKDRFYLLITGHHDSDRYECIGADNPSQLIDILVGKRQAGTNDEGPDLFIVIPVHRVRARLTRKLEVLEGERTKCRDGRAT